MKAAWSILGGFLVAASALAAACVDQIENTAGSANYYSTDAAADADAEADGEVDASAETADAAADPDAASDAGTEAGTTQGPVACTKAEVQAILNAHCTSCHSGAYSAASMDLSGDFLTSTQNVPSSRYKHQTPGYPAWVRIVPGNPAQSLLNQKIRGYTSAGTIANVGPRMPKGSSNGLSASQLQCIESFIASLP
jgi:hypothetical protein